MTTGKWIYTGEKLRAFLQRNGLSYKEAAAKLGIDKNTVGKAVRGGNLNIDILLLICNEYGLNMTDFFTIEDNVSKNYLNSLSEEVAFLEEECEKYKKCEFSHIEVTELQEGLQRSIALLQEVTEGCQRYCDLLNNKITQE